MGHKLSKSSVLRTQSNIQTKSKTNQADLEQKYQKQQQELSATINLQIAGEEEITPPILDSAEVRQIIIKIQLAKMENGNIEQLEEEEQLEQRQLSNVAAGGDALSAVVADTYNANEKILNVTLGAAAATTTFVKAEAGAQPQQQQRTAGSSTEAPKSNERQFMNNNNLAGNVASASAAVKMLQLHDGDVNVNGDVAVAVAVAENDVVVVGDDESEIATASLLRRRQRRSSVSNEGVDYCEVLEQQPTVSDMWPIEEQRAQAHSSNSNNNSNSNNCCHRRSSKISTTTKTDAAGGSTTQRRGFVGRVTDLLRGRRESVVGLRSLYRGDRRSTPAALQDAPAVPALQPRMRNSVAVAEPSHVSIWANAHRQGDVIIRVISQSRNNVVIEQAAAPFGNSSNHNNNNNNASNTLRLVASTEPAGVRLPIEPSRLSYGPGVTVHSQIDFMHCLVPDMERIIKSTFYWGKMDRYEAERLLEGKPEGTFLLRDSAQEEFLFSVTFRKYGRSLHARIEQSGHKFSFDCHDPCVFTALTVTGLLEHYKDPSCVMFFEPCLTIPLHRRETFSLQELTRATIVSNTTYDGINQLELPGRLKSYLKEYHYKQKLRVKPCDANTPAPYYTNM